jgi:hypothetical protein
MFAAMTLSDFSFELEEYIKPKMKRQHLFAILFNYYSIGATVLGSIPASADTV